jgi:hypothetical protein
MEFPPHVPDEVAHHFKEMDDRAHAAEHMRQAIDHTLAIAERYAHHTAERAVVPYNAENRDAVTVLVHRIYQDAHRRAVDALAGAMVNVQLVVPLWLQTAAGAEFPHLSAITVPHTPPATAPTVNLIALANRDRPPSLWLTDWAWVGVYPVTTPYHVAGAIPTVEARPCTGTCDNDAQGAA